MTLWRTFSRVPVDASRTIGHDGKSDKGQLGEYHLGPTTSGEVEAILMFKGVPNSSNPPCIIAYTILIPYQVQQP